MSPLIIVGILLSTALADVSHVLSGTAYPSPSVSPVDVNSLSAPKNGFQSGNPNDFWWMSPNSPLKEAYEYFKKCSNKGDCVPPVSVVPGIKVAEAHFDPIDLEKNPFLNGKFQAGLASSSSSFSSSSTGCTSCGSKQGDITAFHSGTKIDVSNNPFLNGQFSTAGNGEKIKNENGFIGVQPKKPAFATSHPLSNKKPFPTSVPNAPQSFVLGERPKGVQCQGRGYLCVAKNLCINGVLNRTDLTQVRNDVQYCNADTEVCCQLSSSQVKVSLPNISGKTDLASTINNLAEISLGKSSVTGSSFKFSGGAGSSPGQIQVLIDQPDEVNPQISHHGESGQASTNKATRDVTPSGISSFGNTVDYSGVQISNDVRFGSTIRGPAYLPPIDVPSHPTTSLVCPAGTILTPSGTCEPLSTPVPQCPFGTYRTPDGNCERQIVSTPTPTTFIETTRLACPVGTILTPSGTCESPSTPIPQCPPGTIRTPNGNCERQILSTTPAPCPFGTFLTPDGNCVGPSPAPTPKQCPPGTFLTPSGLCEAPTPPPPPPTPQPCPPGTLLTPSGLCEALRTTPRPTCPPGTIQSSSGICEQIVSSSTPGYEYSTPSCPPGTIRTLTGLCESIVVTTERPQCPLGSYLTPSGDCELLRPTTPKPLPKPFEPTASREYLPPVTPVQYVPKVTKKPYQPSVTSEKPFQSSVTQTQPVTPFRTSQPSVTTSKPFQPSPTQQIPTETTKQPSYSQFTTPVSSHPAVTTLRPFQTSPPKPPQKGFTPSTVCSPGQVVSPSGYGCVYSTTPRPSFSQVVTSRPPQPTTLRPYQPSSTPAFPITTQKDTCLPGQRLSPSGTCEYISSTPGYEYPTPTSCRFGQVLSSSGSCVDASQSSSGRPPTSKLCAFGQISSSSGECIYPSSQFPSATTPSRRPQCGSGQILSPSGSCISPQSTPKPSRPRCPQGQYLSPSGECKSSSKQEYPRPTPVSCGPNQELSPSGVCQYITTTEGYIQTTPSPTKSCGFGQVLSQSGACIYSSRQPSTPQVTGPTERPQFQTSPSCKPGQVPSPSGYGCIYPSPSSTIRPVASTPGYSYSKPSTSCEPGQVLSQTGSCIYPSKTTPAGSTGPRPSCGPGQVPKSSGIGCEYPNTPRPTFPGIGTKPSCPFGTKLNPVTKECLGSQEFTGPTSTPQPPLIGPSSTTQSSCRPGQVLSASGICTYTSQPQSSCPPGQFKSPEGFCIYPSDTTTIIQPTRKPPCSPGQIVSAGICVYPSETTPIPSQKCRPDQILSSSGSCVSVPTETRPTSCVGYECKYQQSTTRPSRCPPGQVPSISGSGCEYPKQVTPFNTARPASCPFGTKLSPITNECITASTKRPDGYDYPKPSTDFPFGVSSTQKPISGKQCPFGQTLSPSGTCTYPGATTQSDREPHCRPGQILSDSGVCIYPGASTPPSCAPGQVLSASGSCIYPSSPSSHSFETTTVTSSIQKCGPGQELSPSGSCIYSPKPTRGPLVSTPTACASGQVLSASGVCYYPSSQTEIPRPGTKPSCGSGQVLSPSGTCYYPAGPSPSTPLCAQGQILSSNGSCIPSRGVTTPQDYYSRPTSKPTPLCGPGQVLSPSGSCTYSSQTTPQPGYEYSRPTPYAPGYTTPQPGTKATCGAGQELTPSGRCIYPSRSSPRPSCGPGQVLSPSGSCTYSSQTTPRPGYEYSRPTPYAPGYTTPQPGTKVPCGTGQELTASGRCIYPSRSSPKSSCGPGQVPSPSGFCIYSTRLTPTTSTEYGYSTPSTPFETTRECGPGQTLSPSGVCIYSPQSTLQPRPTTFGYDYSRPSTPSAPGYPSQTTTPQQETKIKCRPGQELSSSGRCIYPLRPTPTSSGYDYPRPSTPFAPGYPSQTTTPQPGTKITCGPGQELSASGRCIYPLRPSPTPSCGPGQVLSPSGSCTYSSQTTPRPGYEYSTPTPFVPGFTGQPTTPQPGSKITCGPGQELSAAGKCIYPLRPSSKPSCGPGQVLSPSGSCTYSSQTTPRPGYEYSTPTPFVPGFTGQPTTPQAGSKITCGPGQELSAAGKCIYPLRPSPKPSCGPGQVLSPSGSCIYSPQTTPQPGYEYSRPTPSIPGYTTPQPGTKIPCRPGQELSASGRCIYPSRTSPKPSCSPGQVLSPSGSCTYPSRPTQGPFPTTSPPEDVYSTPFESNKITTRKQCGIGQVLSPSGICIYSQQSTTPGYEYSRPSTPFRPGYSSQTTPQPGAKITCRPGQELTSSGTCIYPARPTPKPSCSPGQVLSPSGSCIYSPTTPQSVPTTPPEYVYSTPSSPFGPGQTTVRPTTRRQCGLGQILSPSGICVYPEDSTGYDYPKPSTPFIPGHSRQTTVPQPGYEYSTSTPFIPGYTSQPTPKPGTKICGPGQELSASGRCVYSSGPSTKPSCGPGQVLSPSGSCIYFSQTTRQPGYEYSTPVPSAPGYTTPQPGSKVLCGPGQELSPSGRCIYPSGKPSCGPGQILSPSGSCTYSSQTTPRPGYEYSTPSTGYTTPQPGSKVPCGPGQELSPSGRCIYPSRKPSCGPGQILSPSGSCTYSSQTTTRPGYEYSTPTPFVPGYTTPQPGSKVPCGPGQELSPSGQCVYSSRKPSCGPGQVVSPSGSCTYSSQTTTRPGYEYSTPTPFVPGYTTPQPGSKVPCGPGQELSSSGSCTYSSQTTPRPGYEYSTSTPFVPGYTTPQPGSKIPCGPGQELSPSGRCIYPSGKPSCGPGQVLSPSGSCTYSSQTTPRPGYEYSTPTPLIPGYTTPQPGTKITCGPGQELSASGRCIYTSKTSPKPSCSPGQVLSPSGLCTYPSRPTPGPFPTTSPPEDVYSTPFESNKITTRKQCGVGQVLSPSGICIYSQQPTLQPIPTTPGYEYSRPSTPFIPGYSSQTTLQPGAKITCRPGQELSESGVCFYPSKTSQKPSCGPGQILSSSGTCIYSSRPPQPTPSVTTGYEYPRTSPSGPTPSPYPSQTCGPNQVLSSSGTCVYSSRPGVPTVTPPCGPGQVLSQNGICVYASRPTTLPPIGKPCRPGQILSQSGICISSTSSFIETTLRPKQCLPGSKCDYPEPTTSRSTVDISGGYKYPRPDKPLEPKPQCPPGQRLGPFGTCEPQSVLTTTPSYEATTDSFITSRPCPPGSQLSPSGTCRFTSGQSSSPTPKYPIVCPEGTVKSPSGLCESSPSPGAQCPFGTRLSPSGSCERTSNTPRPDFGKSCPPGTVRTSSGLCESSRKPVATCPPGSSLSPSGKCQYPPPTPIPGRPSNTDNQFTPSYPTKKPYRPEYVESGSFQYPSSQVVPILPTTPQYLPPVSDREITGSNIQNAYITPSTSTVRIPLRTTSRPDNINGESILNINRSPVDELPVGCAAALKCVQEIYCTAEGVVSPVPVVLTKDQEFLRVPTTECRNEETGIIGKCCRDPNYKDPWPSANLVNGVDDGQYKEDNLYGQRGVLATNRLVRSSNGTKTNVRRRAELPQNVQEGICGERHTNTKPTGPGPIDANFSEYPWQAMILRDSNRSLLCGGAIIRRNAVLTAAHCVEGLDTSDVLIKGGEWKLGIDEEPLPFQIVKVGAILRHPDYVPGSYKNDLAVLILRERLRPSKNVGTICLPDSNQPSTANCVATGWGKRILQLHAKGAIMHHINVNVLDSQQCQQTLAQNFESSLENYNPANTLCGTSDIDHCKVDYGSALACTNSQGQYTLAGIYAWDTGCKEEGQIGAYVAPDVEWIESTLSKSIKELKKIEREYLLKSQT